MILSAVGLVTAIKKQNGLNKLIGIIGLIGGLIFLGGGIFGLMLIYVVVGG
jgi:hypothetical protein